MKFDWSKAPEWATQVAQFYENPKWYWLGAAKYREVGACPETTRTIPEGTTFAGVFGTARILELRPEPKKQQSATPANTTVTAPDFLRAAIQHQEDRAATYDSPEGERSMAKTVEAFNAITGHKLTEEQGWLFMGTLKKVRSQQGAYRADNYEDEASYAALRGECAARTRG